MSDNRVRLASPHAAYLAHKTEIDDALHAVLDSGSYILGEQVSRFEEEFAAYIGCGFAVGVASGTDAIELALRACGIGAGDAVLTVSNTAVATVAAIERSGAEVVLADVDESTYTVDVARLDDTIARDRNHRIRAIVPVHLYGHPAAIKDIVQLAALHGLRVIEDCAQAHGALVDNQRVGSWGDIGAFSFYPTKNLGAIGDGGAIVTNDSDLAQRVRMLRQYGWLQRYVSESQGTNSRLDELQASLLRVKLRYLDEDNRCRRVIASAYTAAFRGTNTIAPEEASGCLHVYHQYVVRSAERDALRRHLDERGIDTVVSYPTPIHLQPAYAATLAGSTAVLPQTERLAREIVSLPMFPQLDEDAVARVIEAVTAYR